MSLVNVTTLRTLDGQRSVDVADIFTTKDQVDSQNINHTDNSYARKLSSILSDAINVKNLGAKGDHSTDDTAAIKAALNQAATYSDRGGIVFFPSGIYNVSETITVPKYVTLVGAGRFATLIRCTEDGEAVSPIVKMSNSFSTLRGISVVYSSAQTTKGTCILTTGSSNTLEDFNASAGYYGIHWYSGSATKMQNFDVYDCDYTSILIGESTSGFSNDLIMDNFFVVTTDSTNNSLGAIRILGRVEALFASNFDLIGSTYPITTDPGSTNGLRFSSFTNGFFDSGTNPCNFSGVNNTTLTDCWFSNRAAGAVFTNCFSLDIKGARVWNNDAQGFIFQNSCHHINCSGDFGNNNLKSGNGVQDIYIDGTCSMMNIHNIVGYEAGNTSYLAYAGSGAAYVTFRDVKVTTRASGYLSFGGSNTGLVVDGVAGFITKASGTSSIAASGTSVTVSHGLSMTPSLKDISITPNGATAANLYVSAVTATTFTVSTGTANTGAAYFSWKADTTQS